MWFLSCDGDHLNGKQIWLRPGSKHLFGRTRAQEDNNDFHAITHKSVSRQHFELEVSPVERGASAQVHKRSKIIITDLGSKVGTSVDGDKVRNTSMTLTKPNHVIRLGSYEVPFHIKWQPMVLTFTSLPRSVRQAADPLAEQRAKIEHLDVKLITDYITNSTTHVVSKKRNTATALQALVNGKTIVTEAYVDAIEEAGRQTDNGKDQALGRSKLEQDFELNWPRELDYLPPPGAEHNPRGEHDEIFLPKLQRSEMFSKFVFIFTLASQYDTLLPVITGGGGKALLKEVAAPEDDPDFDEFLEYVKSCAGKKGDAAFRLSQYPATQGGVVVVRPGDPTKVGGPHFFQKLDLALDQRSVEQNEFLEAILTTDATLLRRALEEEDEEEAPPPAPSARNSHRRDSPARTPQEQTEDRIGQAPETSAPKSRSRRVFNRQKITTFDDFDPSQIVKYSPPPTQNNLSQIPSESPSLANSDVEMDYGPSQRTRKRAAESQLQPVESTEQVLDGILTGQAALKRRRLEEAAKGKSTFSAPSVTTDQSPDGANGTKTKKRSAEQREQDMQKTILARREEQERRRAEDEERLRTAMEGMDVSEMRNLAQVEDMPVREPRRVNGRDPGGAGAGGGDRWKPEWNGRANWKRFRKRRPGETAASQDAGPARRKVVVELRPYNPDEGSVVEGWLDPVPSAAGRKGRASQASGGRRSAGGRDSQVSGTQHSSNSNGRASRGRDTDGDEDSMTLTGGEGHGGGGTGSAEELRAAIERSRAEDEQRDAMTELVPDEIGNNSRDPALKAQLRERREGEARRKREEREERVGGRKGAVGQASGQAQTQGTARAGTKRGRDAALGADDDDDEGGGLKFRRRRRG